MGDKKNLIPDDDFEFEKEKFEHQKELSERLEQERKERREAQEKERREYEKKLDEEKRELVKLKQGVIDKSEIIKEQRDEKIVLTKSEWIKNFWWHNKFIIIGVVFALAVIAFITYDTLSRDKPDIKIIMTVNNGLVNRTEELSDFFESYCDDLNGDGKVVVQIISAPLTSDTDDYVTLQKYQEVYLANMQTGEIIFILSDDKTDADIYSDDPDRNLLDDMTAKFPDNDYVTKKGLSLKGSLVEDSLKYHNNMPGDMYLGMRKPIKTLKDSKEDMQKNYDDALKMFERLADDLLKQDKTS